VLTPRHIVYTLQTKNDTTAGGSRRQEQYAPAGSSGVQQARTPSGTGGENPGEPHTMRAARPAFIHTRSEGPSETSGRSAPALQEQRADHGGEHWTVGSSARRLQTRSMSKAGV